MAVGTPSKAVEYVNMLRARAAKPVGWVYKNSDYDAATGTYKTQTTLQILIMLDFMLLALLTIRLLVGKHCFMKQDLSWVWKDKGSLRSVVMMAHQVLQQTG
jgi:hypothetical protein